MSSKTEHVAEADGAIRLDRWFHRHYPALRHGELERLLRTGQVRVDGRRAKAGDRLMPGQAIRVPPLGGEAASALRPARPVRPQDAAMLEAAILHRDGDMIVIDKPAGLAVQGGSRTERHLDGLLDALRFGESERPRLVHRLDKETSGVLVLARSAAAEAFLAAAFREGRAKKLSWALVAGLPKPPQGRIDLALAKSPGPKGGRVRPDEEEGRRAATLYRVLDSAGERASWLALSPLTGRTHQLRAHCAALGTPILGDEKYGGGAAALAGLPAARRLHLHARAISLPHPKGSALRIEAPLPRDMRASWKFFGFAADAPDPFADGRRGR